MGHAIFDLITCWHLTFSHLPKKDFDFEWKFGIPN
jgi:hypothetical protein